MLYQYSYGALLCPKSSTVATYHMAIWGNAATTSQQPTIRPPPPPPPPSREGGDHLRPHDLRVR